MMDSPMKTIGFLIGYLISLHLIKEHMANKKPYELRGFLIFYNFIQVIGSFYIFLEVNSLEGNQVEQISVVFFRNHIYQLYFHFILKILIVAYNSDYSLVCQPVDYSNDPLPTRVRFYLIIY